MNLSKLSLSPLNRLGVTGKFILAIAITMTLLFLVAGHLIINLQDRAMESELRAAEKSSMRYPANRLPMIDRPSSSKRNNFLSC